VEEMMIKKPCIWNGIEYESISAAARATNRTVPSMIRLLKSGYTCEADLKQSGPKAQSCTWNGIEYETIADAAEANHITYCAMRLRLINGQICDDDLGKPRQKLKRENELLRDFIQQICIGMWAWNEEPKPEEWDMSDPGQRTLYQELYANWAIAEKAIQFFDALDHRNYDRAFILLQRRPHTAF
jgi:hypothetical protein